MYSKILISTILIVCAAVGIVVWWWYMYRYTKILPIENKIQNAVFYITLGYTGDLGSAPVISPRDNMTRVTINNVPLYFNDKQLDEVKEVGRMPACIVGRPLIRVSAAVTLTKESGWSEPIPGEEEGFSKEFYQLSLNKIHSISVRAKPCKE